jgi:hypothetical protein
MAAKGAVLASRILNEVAALGLVVGRVERAWKAAAANNDEFYYDSVALNIHSFYSGLERVLEKIASAFELEFNRHSSFFCQNECISTPVPAPFTRC